MESIYWLIFYFDNIARKRGIEIIYSDILTVIYKSEYRNKRKMIELLLNEGIHL